MWNRKKLKIDHLKCVKNTVDTVMNTDNYIFQTVLDNPCIYDQIYEYKDLDHNLNLLMINNKKDNSTNKTANYVHITGKIRNNSIMYFDLVVHDTEKVLLSTLEHFKLDNDVKKFIIDYYMLIKASVNKKYYFEPSIKGSITLHFENINGDFKLTEIGTLETECGYPVGKEHNFMSNTQNPFAYGNVSFMLHLLKDLQPTIFFKKREKVEKINYDLRIKLNIHFNIASIESNKLRRLNDNFDGFPDLMECLLSDRLEETVSLFNFHYI